MARIFLTGASGFIGGEVLHALKSTYPQYEYAVLLRDQKKAKQVSKIYPDIKVVLGDLDSASIIEQEARQADVVIHTASSNHAKSVESIARGLTASDRKKNGHWLQISGASVLSIPDIEKGAFGEASDKIYSDLDGAEELRAHIRRYSSKRIVDNFILDLAPSPNRPKTALIFPPIIYGRGRGPVNQRSIQIPELARVSAQRRAGVQVGKGNSIWSNVHISDIGSIFLKLVEKALKGEEEGLWNENGLYFPGNGEVSFGIISQLVTQELHKRGLVDSTSVTEIDHSEADSLTPHGGVLWGTNARQHSQRVHKYLGWVPAGKTLEGEIPATVEAEIERLKLNQSSPSSL